MRCRAFLIVSFVVIGLGGCAPKTFYVIPHYTRPARIAVLPMRNNTTDLDGPISVRTLIQARLMNSGYVVIPLEQIDSILKDKGFNEAGQLNAATPQELGEWLNVDGLFYSTLEEFAYINVGFYWRRNVVISGKLVLAKSGDKLWEAERGWSTLNLEANPQRAKEQFAAQLAVKAFEKMTHNSLLLESRRAVELLIRTLP